MYIWFKDEICPVPRPLSRWCRYSPPLLFSEMTRFPYTDAISRTSLSHSFCLSYSKTKTRKAGEEWILHVDPNPVLLYMYQDISNILRSSSCLLQICIISFKDQIFKNFMFCHIFQSGLFYLYN